MRPAWHYLIECALLRRTQSGRRGIMTKGGNLSEFELYLAEVQHRARRSLSEIEKLGTDAALDRCRDLASQVQAQLRKLPRHTVDIQSLADFQVSLERACSVLAQKSGHSSKEGIQDEP
jgi:hypothetical protein